VEKIWRIDVATAHGPQTHTARHIVSSAPVRELIDKLSPRPISQFHAQSLRYRDFITVALMVKRPDLATDNSIYIHDASVKVSRVQNFQARAADMAPEGMGCLGLEYFCFEGDDLWCASDDELIYLAKREAAHIGLVAVSDIADACVVRQLKAYPIYDDDHRHNMAMIRLDLETHYPTLHLVGRNGMHKDNSLDHAMMTAILTARNILADARIHDVWNIGEAAVTAENTDAEAA
jgi:protoporphyrinogen oxidase